MIEMIDIFDPLIIDAIYPERTYPKWELWRVKRKYGKYSAIYIDIWQPYMKSLFELLPKTEWREQK